MLPLSGGECPLLFQVVRFSLQVFYFPGRVVFFFSLS
jgi:hypothetical protein